MASPVDTSVKHFTSAMLAAPVLNGTAGSLVNILDACLVTGFDIKAATSLVVANGVATLSFTGTHSATVDSVILVENASIVALNGEQKVTSVAAGVVRFATAAANGTATGAITFKMAPVGWAKSFTGTNLAAYRSTDVASTGMYLRVDDTGTTSCRVVGYEQMTDINTGSGAFPTTAQLTGGGYWAKSNNANAVPVMWSLFADSRAFLLHVSPNFSTSTANTTGVLRGFGDVLPFRPGGDPYACLLNVSIASGAGSQGDSGLDLNTVLANCYMPRAFTGLGSSVQTVLFSYAGGNASSGNDSFLGAFPSAVDGGLRLSRKAISATTVINATPRCDLTGLYHVPHTGLIDTFKGRDVILGTGALAGRRLMAVQSISGYNAAPTSGHGIAFLDITGPWR